jgi:TatD DNase family protein
MISPSSTIHESEASVELIKTSTEIERSYIQVKTTVGAHPYHCKAPPSIDELGRLRALLEDSEVKQYISCIGETGLDYSDGFPDRQHQLPWFIAQLDLAFEYNLPIFLHERLAFRDTLQCIDEAIQRHDGKPMPKIIVHCYTGSFEECIEYIKRGYSISVSGYIIKDGDECDQVRRCLREGIVPLDKLMIETDAPYMGFSGNKDAFFDVEGDSFSSLSAKKRKKLKSIYPNVPSVLPLVLKAACDVINVGREQRGEISLALEELGSVTTQNAKEFFGLL